MLVWILAVCTIMKHVVQVTTENGETARSINCTGVGIVCPECVYRETTSRVNVGIAMTTSAGAHNFHDENGVYHSHDNNISRADWTCSNGHAGDYIARQDCPARTCSRGYTILRTAPSRFRSAIEERRRREAEERKVIWERERNERERAERECKSGVGGNVSNDSNDSNGTDGIGESVRAEKEGKSSVSEENVGCVSISSIDSSINTSIPQYYTIPVSGVFPTKYYNTEFIRTNTASAGEPTFDWSKLKTAMMLSVERSDKSEGDIDNIIARLKNASGEKESVVSGGDKVNSAEVDSGNETITNTPANVSADASVSTQPESIKMTVKYGANTYSGTLYIVKPETQNEQLDNIKPDEFGGYFE